MGKLFGKIAGTYDKPSKAELLNLQMLKDRFARAQDTYKKFRKKVLKKLFKGKPIQYKSFEKFVE